MSSETPKYLTLKTILAATLQYHKAAFLIDLLVLSTLGSMVFEAVRTAYVWGTTQQLKETPGSHVQGIIYTKLYIKSMEPKDVIYIWAKDGTYL